MSKTLLVDGEWLIRINSNKRKDMRSGGEWCGGSYGFLDSLRSIINKLMPDRVVVFWDGKAAGVYRKDIYPLYKSNRGRDFSREAYGLTERGFAYEENKKNSLLKQKIKIKNYLEELYIRQLEVDFIEADDLIAGYANNKNDDDVIYIYSSDKDYYILLKDNINIIRPLDMSIISVKNFKEKFGFHYENAIIVKCFEGDKGDCIQGINGINKDTLINFFPKMIDEKITIDEIISISEDLLKNKKSKKLKTIIESKEIFELNKKLMDLDAHPFLTQDAVDNILDISQNLIVDPNNSKERSVENAMKMFIRDGYHKFLFNENYSLFFQPFYRISVKELEYSKTFLKY